MNKIEDVLPWRNDLEIVNDNGFTHKATDYAGKLISDNEFSNNVKEELIKGLVRAAIFYEYGKMYSSSLKEQQIDPEFSCIKEIAKPNPNRPKKYEDLGIIYTLAIVYKHFGGRVGTSYNRIKKEEEDSPFMRFSKKWILIIDPDRNEGNLPKAGAFKSALKKLKEQQEEAPTLNHIDIYKAFSTNSIE